MREPPRDKERLNHMLAAIERVIRYTSGKAFDDLKSDDMMYYAVVKNIEIIGEAANLLSPEFIASHPATPWKQVRGMRNYIVHEYFQIDDVVVWGVVKDDIPILQAQINDYLSSLFHPQIFIYKERTEQLYLLLYSVLHIFHSLVVPKPF